MRVLKLGAIAGLVVITGLALLWVTEAIPREDVRDIAPKALGAVLVLIVAGAVLVSVRGKSDVPDPTDKPVP